MKEAKTATNANPALVAAIARVEPALAAWRQRRKHREAIPDALWRAMVPLARVHGVSPVAQALRINYTTLKNHLVADQGSAPRVADPDPVWFVEVPVASWPCAPQWIIELEDRLGAKLTLRSAQGGSTEALAVAQGLWSARA